MIDFEVIKDIIWQYCNDLLNIEVIRADQTGDRPATSPNPYLTFKILSGPSRPGMDSERVEEGGTVVPTNVKLVTEGQRNMTISFQSFGSGAGTLMSKLETILGTNLGREKLAFLGREKGISIAFITNEPMQDITSLIQSEYEERLQMDATFRTVSIFEEELPPVDEVVIGTSEEEAEAGDLAIRSQDEVVKAPGKVIIKTE